MQFAQHIYLLFWAKDHFSLWQEARQPHYSVAIQDSVWLQSAHNKMYHTEEIIL